VCVCVRERGNLAINHRIEVQVMQNHLYINEYIYIYFCFIDDNVITCVSVCYVCVSVCQSKSCRITVYE